MKSDDAGREAPVVHAAFRCSGIERGLFVW